MASVDDIGAALEAEAASAPPRQPRWRRAMRVGLGWILLFAAVVVGNLRWFPDASQPLALLSYQPAPGLMVLAAVAALMTHVPLRVRVAMVAGALLLLAPALAREQPNLLASLSAQESPDAPRLRVAVYNVLTYHGGIDRIAEEIRRADPDVIGLLEGTTGGNVPAYLRRELGPEYTWSMTRRLAIASRLPIRETTELPNPGSLKVFRSVIVHEGREFAFILVDTPSPDSDRAAYRAGLELALGGESLPHVVAGDLNTPRQSRLLRDIFADHRDPFTEAPVRPRWLGSWPTPLPLWQLDRVVASREFEPLAAEFFGGLASDHAGALADLAWRDVGGVR